VLTLLGIFLRRWYVILPGLILAVVAAWVVNDRAIPEYETAGTLMLAMAPDAEEDDGDSDAEPEAGEGADPPGSESVAGVAMSGRVIAEVVQSDAVRLRLLEEGLGAQYTVEYMDEGSLLEVQATADAEEEAVLTAQAVVDELDAEIESRQDDAGLEGEDRMAAEVVAEPSAAVLQETEEDDGTLTTQYVSRGVVAMVDMASEETAPNPLGANQESAQILANVMNNDAKRDQVAEHDDFDYSVGQDRQDAAPFLYVTATGPEPDGVLETYSAARAAIEAELESRQEDAGVEPESRVVIETISEPTEVEDIGGDGIRAALTVLALIAALAFGVALLVESVVNALARRREQEAQLPLLYSETTERGGTDLERTH
jgi:F0F1-type ATP synthase membrane subunit c/vacuolar-type H+-ATPase subunit K